MKRSPSLFLVLTILTLVIACTPTLPTPPDGWQQRVNNNIIGKITLNSTQFSNCATTSGRHVICPQSNDTLDYVCAAVVTFTDGTATQRWELPCELIQETDTLLFDDGAQTYFYGTKK